MVSRIACGVLAISLIAGCASKKKEDPVVTADQNTFMRVRSDLLRMDPNARVGQVTEVSPEQNFAAVGSMPTDGLTEGAVLTFLDGNQNVLTTGKVIRVLPDAVHVKYEAPAAGTRAPVVNDLAVRFN